MDYTKLIWFRPSYDGREHMPQVVYAVDARIITSAVGGYVLAAPEIKEIRAGHGRMVRTQDLVPYSEELWHACEGYIAFHAWFRAEARKRRDALKKGQALRQMVFA